MEVEPSPRPSAPAGKVRVETEEVRHGVVTLKPPFRQRTRLLLALAATMSAHCTAKASVAPAATVAEATIDGPGYRLRTFSEPAVGQRPRRTYWLYTPASAARDPLPLVVVAGAGSRLFHGMELGNGDRAEHEPWARAGFVVVAYSIDGAVSDEALQAGGPEMDLAITQFRHAHAGVDNTRAAIDLAVAQANIDESRIFAAGHSSAGTLALLAASQEPRITAVAAFAPCTDVEAHLGPLLSHFRASAPEVANFLSWSSPKGHVSELKVPVFLFHADDDQVVSITETRAFSGLLSASGASPVEFRTVATGGHYGAMIGEGVPAAIQWASSLRSPSRVSK